jgi:shikimate kinase
MHSEVRAFLSPVASVVYLELSIESLLARLERDATRPLLNQESDRRRVLEKQLEERISFYKQSTITVNTDVSVGQVVQEIIQKLKLA